MPVTFGFTHEKKPLFALSGAESVLNIFLLCIEKSSCTIIAVISYNEIWLWHCNI